MNKRTALLIAPILIWGAAEASLAPRPQRDTRRLYYAYTNATVCPYSEITLYSDWHEAERWARAENAPHRKPKWHVYYVDVTPSGTLWEGER